MALPYPHYMHIELSYNGATSHIIQVIRALKHLKTYQVNPWDPPWFEKYRCIDQLFAVNQVKSHEIPHEILGEMTIVIHRWSHNRHLQGITGPDEAAQRLEKRPNNCSGPGYPSSWMVFMENIDCTTTWMEWWTWIVSWFLYPVDFVTSVIKRLCNLVKPNHKASPSHIHVSGCCKPSQMIVLLIIGFTVFSWQVT